jgi:hypothetical protein
MTISIKHTINICDNIFNVPLMPSNIITYNLTFVNAVVSLPFQYR